MVAIVIDQLGQGSARGRGEAAAVTSEAARHPHVAHVGMRTDDRGAVKIIDIIVHRITVNKYGIVKPATEKLTHEISMWNLTHTHQICP